MIINEHQRRWLEIRFYYFCLDIYHIKNDILDVRYVVEAIAAIGNLSQLQLTKLAFNMMNERYFLPVNEEVVMAAYKAGLKTKDIATFSKLTRQRVLQIIKDQENDYYFCPRLEIDEDILLSKFMPIANTIKKAGSPC